jgi:hypothetical protein
MALGMTDSQGSQGHVPPDRSPCGDVALNVQRFQAQTDYDTYLNKFKRKYPDIYKHYKELVKANAPSKSFEDLRSQLISHKSSAAEDFNKILALKKNVEFFQNFKPSKEVGEKKDIQPPSSRNVHQQKGPAHAAQH